MTNPQVVHETLCTMAKGRAEADHEIGRWLLAADRLGVHRALHPLIILSADRVGDGLSACYGALIVERSPS